MAAYANAPRAAIERKSGSLDFTDGYAQKMVRWRDALMSQARLEMQSYIEIQEAERYIDLLSGSWWNPNRPLFRSQFYDNYLADQRREAIAALTDIRPNLDISCKVEAYKGQAKILSGYVRHLWDEEDLDLRVADWVDHALFGTGFVKQTATEPGDFTFTPHGLDQVHPVMMNGNDLQAAAAVIYRVPKILSYFQQKFGEWKCAGLERQSMSMARDLGQERYQRPDSIPEYTWNSMSPTMRRRMAMRNGPTRQMGSANASPFPVLELMEVYVDDSSVNEHGHDVLVKHPDLDVDEHNYHYIVPKGCRLYPRKRLAVFAGDRVMYDGPGPNWHGLYPFSMLQLNPCVWNPGGISKYRDLVPLVRSLNRIGAGVDESVMRALNGTWVTKRGAIPDAVWDAFLPGKPGQKVMLNPVANPATDFMEKQAPNLPSQVEMWMRYLVDTIKKRSGSLDIMGMARKKQVPGGDTIAQMQDSMSGPFRLEGRYVEAALRGAGKQMISNIFQYATLDQRMRVLGADGMTWEDFDYYAKSMVPSSAPKEDHWRLFPIKIAPGSTHGNQKSRLAQIAMVLAGQGKLSMRGLYRLLEMTESAEDNMKEIAEEHEAGIGVAPAKGKSPRMTRGQKNGSPV